jgi:hypothetical protein
MELAMPNVESQLQTDLLSLKQEHEELRSQIRQVEDSLAGVDDLLVTAPEETLRELRDQLFRLYGLLLRLKEEDNRHNLNENQLLLPLQSKKIARELDNQHAEITQALERSIDTVNDALPEDAPRERLREASLIVQRIYHDVVGMIVKHMDNEDALISIAITEAGKTPN